MKQPQDYEKWQAIQASLDCGEVRQRLTMPRITVVQGCILRVWALLPQRAYQAGLDVNANEDSPTKIEYAAGQNTVLGQKYLAAIHFTPKLIVFSTRLPPPQSSNTI